VRSFGLTAYLSSSPRERPASERNSFDILLITATTIPLPRPGVKSRRNIHRRGLSQLNRPAG